MLSGTTDKNRFLAALSSAARAAIEARLTIHGGGIGDVLQAANAPVEAVWFPLSGMVSTLRPLDQNQMVEVDAAGAEGFVGIEAILGMTHSTDQWMVQSPGRFARLDLARFRELLDENEELRLGARRYTAAVMAVRGQWVACNARHTIEQRLAKWLLVTRDRVGDEIQITQDTVAMMLGVRRASVVTVLGRFVDDGLVAHGYARVRVVDPNGLLRCSCPCYGAATELLRGGLPGAGENAA